MEKNLDISTNKERLNLPLIHNYLTNSYWAKGRTFEDVKTTIEQSLCFGIYLDGKQIGFARVLTDYVVFAYLMDVFIVEEFQGQGYAKMLLEGVFKYKEVHVNKWMLATKDAHEMYAKFSFTSIASPNWLMEYLPNELR